MSSQLAPQQIKVWDWSVRICHWSLPILIFLLWYTRLDTEIHMIFAQLLMGVLVYRIVWGFVGTPYARFSHFIYGPKRFLEYARAFTRKDKPLYLSHNPMGGLMVPVLLGIVSLQLVTGLFIDDFLFPGPLYELGSRSFTALMTDWHPLVFNVLLLLVGLHLLAILIYRIKGEKLVKAMITGRKTADMDATLADFRRDAIQQPFPWIRFLLVLAVAVLSVLTVFYWL